MEATAGKKGSHWGVVVPVQPCKPLHLYAGTTKSRRRSLRRGLSERVWQVGNNRSLCNNDIIMHYTMINDIIMKASCLHNR